MNSSRLRIIATNDFHGALEPRADASGVMRDGAAYLASAIRRAASECRPVLPAMHTARLDVQYLPQAAAALWLGVDGMLRPWHRWSSPREPKEAVPSTPAMSRTPPERRSQRSTSASKRRASALSKRFAQRPKASAAPPVPRRSGPDVVALSRAARGAEPRHHPAAMPDEPRQQMLAAADRFPLRMHRIAFLRAPGPA